jgi:hypothetical protein
MYGADAGLTSVRSATNDLTRSLITPPFVLLHAKSKNDNSSLLIGAMHQGETWKSPNGKFTIQVLSMNDSWACITFTQNAKQNGTPKVNRMSA